MEKRLTILRIMLRTVSYLILTLFIGLLPDLTQLKSLGSASESLLIVIVAVLMYRYFRLVYRLQQRIISSANLSYWHSIYTKWASGLSKTQQAGTSFERFLDGMIVVVALQIIIVFTPQWRGVQNFISSPLDFSSWYYILAIGMQIYTYWRVENEEIVA